MFCGFRIPHVLIVNPDDQIDCRMHFILCSHCIEYLLHVVRVPYDFAQVCEYNVHILGHIDFAWIVPYMLIGYPG